MERSGRVQTEREEGPGVQASNRACGWGALGFLAKPGSANSNKKKQSFGKLQRGLV